MDNSNTKKDPALAALQQQIREKKKQDPYIAAKMAANTVLDKILAVLNDGRGVHVESVFAALGSLAGYACQKSALMRIGNRTLPENALITVSDKQGNDYYYGDAINRALLEDRLSVWSLIGGAVQQYNSDLPDIKGIVHHVTQSIGTAAFGVPRLPEDHPIRHTPKEYLALWQPLQEQVLDILLVPAEEWPLAYGLAIQKFMEQAKNVLNCGIAAQIVMECAVPMSKVVLGKEASE